MVLSEDKGNFKFGKATMPDETQAEIDQLVAQLKANPNGAYIEIEGHTDNVGPKDTNYKLGLERAEAVKRYLYEHHQVPAAQDQRDQLRRREADRAEQDQGRPRPEPPRRHQGPGVIDLSGRSRQTRPRFLFVDPAASDRGRIAGVGAGMVRCRVHRFNVSTFAGCFAFRPRSDAAGLCSRLCLASRVPTRIAPDFVRRVLCFARPAVRSPLRRRLSSA